MKKWACAFSATVLLTSGSCIYNIYQNNQLRKLQTKKEQLAGAYTQLRAACHALDSDVNPLAVVQDRKHHIAQMDSMITAHKGAQSQNQSEIGSIKNSIRSKLLFPNKFDEMSEQGLLDQPPYMTATQRRRITQLNREIRSHGRSIDSLCALRLEQANAMQLYIDSVFTAQQPLIENIKEISK